MSDLQRIGDALLTLVGERIDAGSVTVHFNGSKAMKCDVHKTWREKPIDKAAFPRQTCDSR